ncbi:MAG: MFS transporter [Pseudomonadota bacterium]
MFIRFARENARWLTTGLLLTLVSSFGQTYFISIFADRIMDDYDLSDGEWGGIYTVATLSSAACLLYAGKFADQIPVSRLAILILAAYACVAVGMALNENTWVLVLLIFGLRFCGQGMISHLGITAMGRWFRAHRGRAVAIAGLGYSIGEAILPRLASLAEPLIGWRSVWLIVAVVLIAGFAPLIAWLARDERSPRSASVAADHSPARDGRHWTRSEVLRNWLFWALVPGIVAASFIGTVIFFQVTHIAQIQGWSKIDMTVAYPVYAATTVVVSLISGTISDRVGPDRLLLVFLLPMGAGIVFVGPFDGIWSWWVALGLTGVTTGIAHALWGVLLPELYGTRNLGAIKAVASAFMVVGSAIGPGITGFVIDLGIDFSGQTMAMAIATVAISILHAWILTHLPSRRSAASTA